MLTLYPAIKPYAVHQLAVDSIHTIYFEECGNPEGLPVLFLHGGPGGGIDPDHRRFFDPSLYRIVLVDQRGSGQSIPHAELNGNTTQALVSDIEAIRVNLKIDKWILFGGSWGSTLALVYAETYPERVMAMILRGIFLCRPEDLSWFYQPGGASRIFPDNWDAFISHLPIEERSDIIQSYYKRLTGADEVARMAAAKAWSQWEGACSTLQPNPQVVNHLTAAHTAMSLARIETHYFMNKAFLEPNQILKNAAQLDNIPGVIVHGRYDVVCPLDNAYELHKVWKNSELQIIREAGHSACEPAIICALVTATNAFAQRFGPLVN
jgi:proline iminopeptidase